jgi:hypothetical protein
MLLAPLLSVGKEMQLEGGGGEKEGGGGNKCRLSRWRYVPYTTGQVVTPFFTYSINLAAPRHELSKVCQNILYNVSIADRQNLSYRAVSCLSFDSQM